MKAPRTVICGLVVLCLAAGCVSTQEHPAYRKAGSPADRRCTLFIDYDLTQPIVIDGEMVKMNSAGFGTAAWIVIMLPGDHVIGAYFGHKHLSGTFTAKNGRNYSLQADLTSPGPFMGSVEVTLHQAYIVELPEGEDHKMTFRQKFHTTGSPGHHLPESHKRVGYLQLDE